MYVVDEDDGGDDDVNDFFIFSQIEIQLKLKTKVIFNLFDFRFFFIFNYFFR